MQMILSQFLPTVHWYSQFLSIVHWYRSARCSLMSSPKLYRNSLENSLQKNISLQHCQEKLPSQRDGFWGQLQSQKRKHQERHLFSTDCLCWSQSRISLQWSFQSGRLCGYAEVRTARGRFEKYFLPSNDIGPGLSPLHAVWPLISTLSRDSSKVMERQVFLLKCGDR